MCMIVSDTDTVLIYEQTKLRWSAKLSHHPCVINRASFKVGTECCWAVWTANENAFWTRTTINIYDLFIRLYEDVWFCFRKRAIWDYVTSEPTRWRSRLQKDKPTVVKIPKTSWFGWKTIFKICPPRTVRVFSKFSPPISTVNNRSRY